MKNIYLHEIFVSATVIISNFVDSELQIRGEFCFNLDVGNTSEFLAIPK